MIVRDEPTLTGSLLDRADRTIVRAADSGMYRVYRYQGPEFIACCLQ